MFNKTGGHKRRLQVHYLRNYAFMLVFLSSSFAYFRFIKLLAEIFRSLISQYKRVPTQSLKLWLSQYKNIIVLKMIVHVKIVLSHRFIEFPCVSREKAFKVNISFKKHFILLLVFLPLFSFPYVYIQAHNNIVFPYWVLMIGFILNTSLI